jgi:hypothetical protein
MTAKINASVRVYSRRFAPVLTPTAWASRFDVSGNITAMIASNVNKKVKILIQAWTW